MELDKKLRNDKRLSDYLTGWALKTHCRIVFVDRLAASHGVPEKHFWKLIRPSSKLWLHYRFNALHYLLIIIQNITHETTQWSLRILLVDETKDVKMFFGYTTGNRTLHYDLY